MRLGQCRRGSLRSLFSLGRWLYALQISDLLGTGADPIVISAFYGPIGVAIYSPARSVFGVVRPLVSVLSTQLFPVATDAYVKGRVQELQTLLIRGTRYTLLMGIPFCVMLGVFATPIMRFWLEDSLGPDYRTTATLLAGWAIVELLNYAWRTHYPILLGMNRLRFLVLTELPAGICNVLLSIWLVGHTQLGIVGAVVATIVVYMVEVPLIAAYVARRCALPMRTYFMHAYLRPLLVLAALTAIGLAMRQTLPFEGFDMLATAIVALGVAWAPLCWWVGFVEQDRRAFAEMFGRMLDGVLRVRPTANVVGPTSASPASSNHESPRP